MILVSIPLTAFSASVLINSLQNIESYSLVAITASVYVDCVAAVLLILGCMAQLFQESDKCLKNMKTIVGDFRLAKDRCAFVKFHKSCQVVKVNFGSSNFVESVTPLNCMDFAGDLTFQLLLMTN